MLMEAEEGTGASGAELTGFVSHKVVMAPIPGSSIRAVYVLHR